MKKKYPMTYEEYKKRVGELFVARATSVSEAEMFKKRLEDEEEVIKWEYESACYHYDNPKMGKDQFTDKGLLYQPVRILDML